MRTILVIRSSAMGDVAMTAPVIKAVLAAYTDVRIVMLTRQFYAPFFGDVERFEIHDIHLANQHRGVGGIYRLYREINKRYKIDLIIDLNDKLYSKLLRGFFSFSGIQSFHIDKGRDEKKALTRRLGKVKRQLRTSIMRYADAFGSAGLPVNVEQTLCRNPKELPVGFAPKNELWIGIAPFAQHAGKVIKIETVKESIMLILKRYPQSKTFIFGGGDAECRLAQELEQEFANCFSVVGKVTLSEEMDVISNLDLMVSMDSSAMHIASLVGVKVVSVWGATHPFAGFLGMGQSVENAVQITDMDCRPCSVYGHRQCYRKDHACLNRITAEMILKKVEGVIGSADSHNR